MKWVTILLLAFGWIVVQSFQPALSAEKKQRLVIEKITHSLTSDGRENVLFKLSTPAAPKVFSIPGENPRIVVDFPNAEFKGGKVVNPGGSGLARGIRVGFHLEPEPKVRVVIDLNPTTPVLFEQELQTEKASFNLTLSTKADSKPVAQTKQQIAQPQKPSEMGEATVADTKTTPAENNRKTPQPKPLVATKPKAEIPSQKQLVTPAKELARLLNITFEGASERGEMVYFYLNEFYPPTVTAVETNAPGVLCQFHNMTMASTVKNNIVADGKFVKQVHTENDAKTKTITVKLDLVPNRNYDLQQVFFKNNNLFVLVVNELEVKKTDSVK